MKKQDSSALFGVIGLGRFGSYNLGTAFAQSGCTFSNFDPASVWIK